MTMLSRAAASSFTFTFWAFLLFTLPTLAADDEQVLKSQQENPGGKRPLLKSEKELNWPQNRKKQFEAVKPEDRSSPKTERPENNNARPRAFSVCDTQPILCRD